MNSVKVQWKWGWNPDKDEILGLLLKLTNLRSLVHFLPIIVRVLQRAFLRAQPKANSDEVSLFVTLNGREIPVEFQSVGWNANGHCKRRIYAPYQTEAEWKRNARSPARDWPIAKTAMEWGPLPSPLEKRGKSHLMLQFSLLLSYNVHGEDSLLSIRIQTSNLAITRIWFTLTYLKPLSIVSDLSIVVPR